MEQGVYTIDIFKKRNIAIQNDINITTKSLKDIKEEYNSKLNESSILDNYIPNTQKLLDVYSNLADAKSKNEILTELLNKVSYIKTEKGTRNKSAPFKIKIYPNILKSRQ